MPDIMHVFSDEKFVDMAVRQFEDARPGVHRYFVVDAVPPFKHVRDARVRSLGTAAFKKEAADPQVAAIVFHSLHRSWYKLVRAVPDDKKTIWIGWGFDYYPMFESTRDHGLLLPGTAKLAQAPFWIRHPESLLQAMATLVGVREKPEDPAVLSRIDYFSPVLDSEYTMARASNEWFTPDYIRWNYGTAEDDFTLAGDRRDGVGDNLLVGNSALDTNNHFEAFQSIKRHFDLAGRKVIVPLSYGNSRYRNKVLRLGEDLLGDSFTPLIDFMPLEQYLETLNSCGYVFMNHVRQQGVGNICISALLGAKIFLNPRNPLYDWLQRQGLTVENIEDPDTRPLSDAEKRANADAIRSHWGRETQRNKTRKLVSVALGE
jgi:dTDP-N-acetylfucosamine:lipid II N-acetylfucosaminyltransferase